MLFTVAFFSQSVNAQTEAQKIELCSKIAGNATFLSSYIAQLPASRDGERPPVFRQATVLRKGNLYRYTICTDEESAGDAILQIFDEGRLQGSTMLSDGRMLTSIDFECNKTGPYVIMVTFRDGREGSAVAVLSHVKTL